MEVSVEKGHGSLHGTFHLFPRYVNNSFAQDPGLSYTIGAIGLDRFTIFDYRQEIKYTIV